MLRITLMLAMLLGGLLPMRSQTPIRGESELTADVLIGYIQRRNPDFDPAIAEAYINLAPRYGIRGDIAICQAIVETGWFRYEGSAVRPEHHNYCGLGVVANGVEGEGFATVDEGVRAHLQHLFAYCSTRKLPRREKMVDPRFKMVARGCATSWEDLSGRWATNESYGALILRVYDQVRASCAR